jgi:hypothetical protein
VNILIIFYVGSGLELIRAMEKGKVVLPWGDFFTCATGLRPALLRGRPGLEGPVYDIFSCLRYFSTWATGLQPALLLGRPGLEGPA